MIALRHVLTLALAATGSLALPQTSPSVANGEARLISVGEGKSQWLNETQILDLIKNHTHFVDVTDGTWDVLAAAGDRRAVTVNSVLPNSISHTDLYDASFRAISTDRMRSFLDAFSNKFVNRYYKADSGQQSSQFLFDTLSQIASGVPASAPYKLTVSKFAHSWKQFSVILRLEPTNLSAKEAVILSAHQDSINQNNPMSGRAPGADDDGSGVTTVLETLQCLLSNSDFVPKRPLEFHFYSGEEGGLLGSQAIAKDYLNRGVPVAAVLHSDMTGFVPDDKKAVFGVGADYVNKDLTNFYIQIVQRVSKLEVVLTKCGYACSDHASWTKRGVPAVFPFEEAYDDTNPYIHTTKDTIDRVNFEHVSEFVKAAIAFAVEVSYTV